MSKQSQNLKQSKTGQRQKRQKAALRSATARYQKQLEEAAKPVPYSLKTDHFGKPLTDSAQLVTFAIGILSVILAGGFVVAVLTDFFAVSGGAYSFFEYLSDCDPVIACRAADLSEAVSVVSLLLVGVITLKIALTNRHAKLRTVRVILGLFILAALGYIVDFILSRVFWQ